MNPFKIGDVVYLNSGSHPMTIRDIDGNNCRVVWHDKNGHEQLSEYSCEALTKEDPNGLPSESFKKT